VKAGEREEFDAIFERVLEALPQRVRDLLQEVSVILDDLPSPDLLSELGIPEDEADTLCGLHTGIAITERSIEHSGELPDVIHLFREGILAHAGGWEPWDDEEGEHWGGSEVIEREIRITLLHEIGHHFGLDEDDLEALGYG
jgi:predicted Zn-dependent protease with MMP-like domain